MSRPPDAAEARRRQIDAIRARAESERIDAQVEKVAATGALVGVAWHAALVLLAAFLVTRGARLASTAGAAALVFDAVSVMFLADTLARLSLQGAGMRRFLAATFLLSGATAALTGLAGIVGDLGPIVPILAKTKMALVVTLFLAAYAVGALYLAAVLGLSGDDALRRHWLFTDKPPAA